MINSLQKDSHITRYSRHRNSYRSQSSVYKNMRNIAPENNSEIITKKPAEINFSGLLSAKKPFNIYTSPRVKRFLELAHNNPAIFNAVFSLGLTCILRPASIMVLPSDKKHADDNKYASAHSIASGIIAYGLSVVLLSPISDGFKKIGDGFEKIATNQTLNNLDRLLKNPKLNYLKDEKAISAAGSIIKMLPETIIAAPRAAITIALIPPILKYVFGWEKKKKDTSIDSFSNNYMAINFKGDNHTKSAAFKGVMGGAK